ncbi:MAG TPA: alanine racemase [Spirochaetes bacterium]|nr:alanine racemase [Spirochaetota bacterium]
MSSLVWVELDSKVPDNNLKELRLCANKDILICAVLKSNAYGHGAPQMAKLLSTADWFAVNSLEEGQELRALGETRPVLVMGHVPIGRLAEAAQADLRLTVYNPETIEALSRLDLKKKPVHVHMKIETGTGRQGVLPGKVRDFVTEITRRPGIILDGVSTHFANIEDTLNHEYAVRQLLVFNEALGTIREQDVDPPVIHTACTAAVILFPETHFTMLRCGIGLYGLWPSRETYLSTIMGKRRLPELKPVLAWKTKIVQIKTLPEGSNVGYGCMYKTTRETVLGVLPVGYADGYSRELGNSAYVLVNEKRASVIGRICMNHTMIDITDIPGAELENEVVLLGSWGKEIITAETIAGWAGTINYDIITRISPFLERRVL